jgi:hypothetical protein
MFTIRPWPKMREPSLAMLERLVGNLTHRRPLAVSGDGWPMSVAQASGTTGSTTMRPRSGTCSTSHERVRLRVSSRDMTRPLWTA